MQVGKHHAFRGYMLLRISLTCHKWFTDLILKGELLSPQPHPQISFLIYFHLFGNFLGFGAYKGYENNK